MRWQSISQWWFLHKEIPFDEGRAWIESLTDPREIIFAAAGLALSLLPDDPHWC